MRFIRLPLKDPRTIARDIPGISEALFPSFVPGVVAYLNRTQDEIPGLTKIPKYLTDLTSINAAMLFEIAYVRAEKMLAGLEIINSECIAEAIQRQSRFYDAEIPTKVRFNDQVVIDKAANNLVLGLRYISKRSKIDIAPKIPGLEWIASSEGDFASENMLIEIKCTAKSFSANDYRQLLFYWLLKSAKLIESHEAIWEVGVLFNPRRNILVTFKFEELLAIVSGGRDVIATIELLQSILISGRKY